MSNHPPIAAALALDGLPTADARAGFEVAAAAGYRGIAFATNHAQLRPDELGPSARRQVKAILAGKHLQVESIRAAGPRGGLAETGSIDRTMDNARKAMGLARELGVGTVAVNIGAMAVEGQAVAAGNVSQATVVAALRELAQHADAAGLSLAVSGGGDAMALAQVLKEVDFERAKVNLEGMQLVGQAEPLRAAELFAGAVGQLTAADGMRKGNALRAMPLGDGQLPLEELLRVLQEQGFAGPLVVDVRELADPVAGARHAAEVLGRLLRGGA